MNIPRTGFAAAPSDNDMKNMFLLQIPIERAAAFMRYMPGTDSARIVKTIKYSNGRNLAGKMGEIVAQEFLAEDKSFFEGIDVIIPTPLTIKRRRERGHNQAEEFAKGLAKETGIPMDSDSVRRVKFTVSQTALDRQERENNVKDAFRCIHPEKLKGKHILLVDDVVTTGATLLALAHSILKNTNDTTFSMLTIGIAGGLRFEPKPKP